PTGGGLLGGGFRGRGQPVLAGTDRLAPDDVLVLCTGMTEKSRDEVTAQLADLPQGSTGSENAPGAAGQPRTAAVCRTATDAIRRTDPRSGLAVLAAQPRAEVPRLAVTLPAIAANVDTVRETVGNWLSGLRSSVEDGAGMALAVGEATANAIQHAFVGGRVGTIRIEASLLSDGELACWVRDDGRWRSPESSATSRRGRGLALMARLCDRIKVTREASGGTVVELRRRLHHPVIRSGGAHLSEA
ncbi:MAG: ATP-binding protein, partial [Actinomycetota bacterium]|nr:ATP-binding protein [Actinomycetota bacterium]